MKKSMLFLLSLVLFGACNIQTPKMPPPATQEQTTKVDFFDKKLKCSEFSDEIEKGLAIMRIEKERPVILVKSSFYSPQYDSCLYAYIIEDDMNFPTCKLEGEMAHNDSLIIKNHLTNTIVFMQTKGCNDFWSDDFEKMLIDLEA